MERIKKVVLEIIEIIEHNEVKISELGQIFNNVQMIVGTTKISPVEKEKFFDEPAKVEVTNLSQRSE